MPDERGAGIAEDGQSQFWAIIPLWMTGNHGDRLTGGIRSIDELQEGNFTKAWTDKTRFNQSGMAFLENGSYHGRGAPTCQSHLLAEFDIGEALKNGPLRGHPLIRSWPWENAQIEKLEQEEMGEDG
jgi:hypothetical protein